MIRKMISRAFKAALCILPLNRKKVIFCTFGGNGYGGNPKYIAQELLKEDPSLDIVWIVKDLNMPIPNKMRKVKAWTPRCYYEYRTSKVIVQDVRNSHFCKKRKRQIYLQTWHAPRDLKKVERAAQSSLSKAYIEAAKYDGRIADAVIVDSIAQKNMMQQNFWLNKEVEYLLYGLPRNDIFFNKQAISSARDGIRRRYNIDKESFVVLYAPTFRDNGYLGAYLTDFKAVRDAFEKKFGKECVVLVRFHPNVDKKRVKIEYGNAVIDATDYPDFQELAMASDCCVSDYSSSPLDFMLMGKPVFLYMKDREEYLRGRGVSEQFLNLPFSYAKNLSDLRRIISEYNPNQYNKNIQDFNKEYPIVDDGKASIRAAKWIIGKCHC